MDRAACTSSSSRMTRSREPRRRGLGEAEQALWQKAMADVKPLRRKRRAARRIVAPSAAAPPASLPSPPVPTAPPPRAAAPVPLPAPAPRATRHKPPPELGIDKNTLTRLKRGEMEITSRIDLHGMTQADAHAALDAFIARGVSRGARLLLVITGKGSGGDGVLRRQLPHWLHAGPHATRILRLEPAHLRHGGTGAWYVYLRRRRDLA
jgi:DNA-nicking Smr family endonuclease